MSGSAVADAAGIGKIIIDMMVKSGLYTRCYAAAIAATNHWTNYSTINSNGAVNVPTPQSDF